MSMIRDAAVALPARAISRAEAARVVGDDYRDVVSVWGLQTTVEGKAAQAGSGPVRREAMPAVGPEVPAAGGNACDLAVEAGRQLMAGVTAPPELLAYCTQTLDVDITTSSICKIQHLLKLKGTVPITVGQCGSGNVAVALEMLVDAFVAEPTTRSALLLAGDQVCPPFERYFFDCFPMGDAAAGLRLDRSAAGPGLALLGVRSATFTEPTAPYTWGLPEFQSFAERIVDAAVRLARQLLGPAPRHPVWLLPQALAPWFVDRVAGALQLPVFSRTTFPGVNLLGADTLVTLKDWLAAGPHFGDQALLLPAGMGHSVGAALVEYRP